jgi:hypothetical protein
MSSPEASSSHLRVPVKAVSPEGWSSVTGKRTSRPTVQLLADLLVIGWCCE